MPRPKAQRPCRRGSARHRHGGRGRSFAAPPPTPRPLSAAGLPFPSGPWRAAPRTLHPARGDDQKPVQQDDRCQQRHESHRVGVMIHRHKCEGGEPVPDRCMAVPSSRARSTRRIGALGSEMRMTNATNPEFSVKLTTPAASPAARSDPVPRPNSWSVDPEECPQAATLARNSLAMLKLVRNQPFRLRTDTPIGSARAPTAGPRART